MKKILSCIIILVMTTLCSCEYFTGINQYAVNQNKTIIEALKARDKEKLKQGLSEALKNQENIDEEIDNFIDFIDGNIVLYKEPEGSEQGQHGPNKDILKRLCGWTRDIVTDTGGKYELYFDSDSMNKEHEDYVGVNYIIIYNKKIYNDENNYPDEGICEIYLKK